MNDDGTTTGGVSVKRNLPKVGSKVRDTHGTIYRVIGHYDESGAVEGDYGIRGIVLSGDRNLVLRGAIYLVPVGRLA